MAQGANDAATSRPAPRPRKGRWGKRILIGVGVLVLLLAVLIGLAPTIARSMAPGFIEEAAGKQISGSLKVQELGLSWGGPTVVAAELRDDQGKPVANGTVTISAGLWKIVNEHWWSAPNLNVGEVTMAGNANIVQGVDGKSNLERAIAPKPGAPAKPAPAPKTASAADAKGIKAVVKVTDLDLKYTDLGAPKDSPLATGVGIDSLKGDINVDAVVGGGPMSVAAKSVLAGAVIGGAPGDVAKVTLDVNVKSSAAGALETADANIALEGIPTALVQGLAGLGREVTQAIGPRADATITAKGNLDGGNAKVLVKSARAGADMSFVYANGRLRNDKPLRIYAEDLSLIQGLPGGRDAIAKMKDQLVIETWPGVEVLVEKLDVPLPKDVIQGKAADPLKAIDLRGSPFMLTMNVGQTTGKAHVQASGPSAEWTPFVVDPLKLEVKSEDLAKPITIASGTKATLGGQSAGQFTVNVQSAGLLDDQGHFGLTALKGLRGEIRASGVNTALAQSFISGMNLPVDLRVDAGPTLDIGATVQPLGDVKLDQIKGVPPMQADVRVDSQNIKVNAPVTFDGSTITSRGDITADFASTVPIINRAMAAKAPAPAKGEKPSAAAPMQLTGKGPVKVTVKGLNVPFDAAKNEIKGGLGAVAATVEAQVRDAASALTRSDGAPGGTVGVQDMTASIVLTPGKGMTQSVRANLAHDGAPFRLETDLATAPLPASMDGTPLALIEKMKPTGKVVVSKVPSSLTKMVAAMDDKPSQGAPDMTAEIMKLVKGMVGQDVDVIVDIAQQADNVTDFKSTVTGKGGLRAAVDAGVSQKQVTLVSADILAPMKPGELDRVLQAATAAKPDTSAPTTNPAPAAPAPPPMKLAGPATMHLRVVEPVRIPVEAGKMNFKFAEASPIKAVVTVDEPLVVENAPIGTGKTVGVRDFTIQATVPGAVLAGGDMKALKAVAVVDGKIVDYTKEPFATLKANVDAGMSGAPLNLAAELSNVKMVAVDRLLDQAGALAGAVGDTGKFTVKTTQTGATADMPIELTIDMPRLTSPGVKAVKQADRIVFSGSQFTWSPDLAWLNSKVFPEEPGRPAAPGPKSSITEMAPLKLALDRLTISMGENTGPLKPGIFAMAIVVTTPKLTMSTGAAGPVTLEGVRTSTWSDKPGEIGFDFAFDRVSGQGATGAQKSLLAGRVTNVADANGKVTSDTAALSVNGEITGFPTPIVDALAGQNGLLTEALGAIITLKPKAENFSKAGGRLSVEALSPRANAKLVGTSQNGVFVTSEPLTVDVYETTPGLVDKLAGSVPLVKSIEKTRQEKPATVRGEGLTIPLDNDMSKLNGVIAVDVGTVKYTLGGSVIDLVKAVGMNKDGGIVGRRIEPFIVRIHQGIATYDKFKLPVGEFNFETTGTVDLVQKKMDVITYVPFFALTDEVAGTLTAGLSRGIGKILPGAIERTTQVPLRTRGPLGSAKTEVDLELFIKEAGSNLIKEPGRVIDDLLKDKIKIPGLPEKPKK